MVNDWYYSSMCTETGFRKIPLANSLKQSLCSVPLVTIEIQFGAFADIGWSTTTILVISRLPH